MVQCSFRLPNADYLGFPATTEAILQTALKAEEAGFDAVFVNDHVIVDDSSRSEPWRQVYDPLMTLAYVAARTDRIQLGTSVLIMPYRNPVVTAKMVATLDQLSDGRAIVGVGSGWNEVEYAALDVPHNERGARTNEYLRIWKACWEPDPVSFHGRFFSFDGLYTSPKPVQQPHPPIWIGGPATPPCGGRPGSARYGSQHRRRCPPWSATGSTSTTYPPKSDARNRHECA